MNIDFGPTGQEPDTERDVPAPDADSTQPVPEHWTAPRVWAGPWTEEWERPPVRRGGFRGVMLAMAVGSLVAVALGAYGRLHDPAGAAFDLAGFSSGLHAKAWLASIAFVLAVTQVLSALAMWGRLPGAAGGGRVSAWLHRWTGRLAVLVSLPVAAHCLYALGFQTFDTRVLAHSLLGCLFYGIFVCKMLVLGRSDRPAWVVPVVGGVLFTALVGLWVTSSLWFFATSGVSL